jgi:hypothetical protein
MYFKVFRITTQASEFSFMYVWLTENACYYSVLISKALFKIFIKQIFYFLKYLYKMCKMNTKWECGISLFFRIFNLKDY